jgi:sulfite reductase beta subunit-like hemoprotein
MIKQNAQILINRIRQRSGVDLITAKIIAMDMVNAQIETAMKFTNDDGRITHQQKLIINDLRKLNLQIRSI